MANVAVGVHVAQKTGQASSTGIVVAMGFLPMVLLAPIAGALADRVDRRRYLATLNFGQFLIASLMAGLGFAHLLSVPLLGFLAFASGCLSALANPAYTALIVELVPGRDLHSALSLNSAQFNLGRVVGPALAAVLFAAAGVPWVFALNAVSFAVIARVLSRVRPPSGAFGAPERGVPLLRVMRQGLGVVAGDHGLQLILGAVFAVGLFVAPFIGFIPVYALRELGGGAELASLLTSVQGVGAVGAVLLLGPLVKRFGVARVTAGALLVIGPVSAAYWSVSGTSAAVALIAVLGGAYLACLTGLSTMGQLRAPPRVHARISGLHAAMLAGGYATGLVGFGFLADRIGLREVFACASFAFALLVGGMWWRLRARGVLLPGGAFGAASSSAVASSSSSDERADSPLPSGVGGMLATPGVPPATVSARPVAAAPMTRGATTEAPNVMAPDAAASPATTRAAAPTSSSPSSAVNAPSSSRGPFMPAAEPPAAPAVVTAPRAPPRRARN